MKEQGNTKEKSPYSSSCSSPPSSPPSSSSSSSFTSFCVGFESDVPQRLVSQPEKQHKPKRARKNNKTTIKNAGSSPSVGRSSIYRGVTRHRWTGRFEAHLWDKSSWNNIQNKKGRQVYLGAYDNEEAAARTYDLAALKYWGPETILNFPIETYAKEWEEMQKATKEEYLASLRRRSSGFSRGVSKYRGVARHHHNGRWEARIGRVLGNKYLYLGTYNTQEEAAEAYDMAAIEYRGPNAVTNFDISNYIDRLRDKGFLLEQPECPTPPEKFQPEEAVESTQQQKKQMQEAAPPPPACMDTSSESIMDHLQDSELDWSFCMDSGLAPLPMPDFQFGNGCELPDLFSNVTFEDNIDLLFDACLRGAEARRAEGGTDDSSSGAENIINGGTLSDFSASPAASSVSCGWIF